MTTSIGSSSYGDSSSSSVHESYRFAGSDSDEDEMDDGIESGSAHMQEIADLKALTKGLLDSDWKLSRNKQLLSKMLELEEPSISPKMVDFLLQEGVCDLLLEFITQIGNRKRPYPYESDSPELKYSYRATMLLSVDEPSDALLSFLSRKASLISRAMFEVFREDSAGSFYHAARIIESLLRLFPGEVYEGLSGDGRVEERMSQMMKYIGYAPVGDLFVILVALTPVPRSSPLYAVCSANRWKFFEGLSRWVFMLKLAKVVVDPSAHCHTHEYVTPEQHSSAAAQTLIELIEKLSSEDMGEILLQPLGHTPSLLDGFVDLGTMNIPRENDTDEATFYTSRRVSLKLLSFLLKRSANEENLCFISGPMATPVPTLVPNRMHPLRTVLVEHLVTRVEDIQRSLLQGCPLTKATAGINSPEPVAHPGYVVKDPFTSHRAHLVELLVLLVEASENTSKKLSVDMWKSLIWWNFEYAHNNIYHSMFYRLLFTVLRANNEVVLKNIFKHAKLVTHLLDAFDPLNESSENGVSADTNTDPGASSRCGLSAVDKKSLRGFVINASNAIRLQVSSLPPSSFLRNFLHSHQRWNNFVPALRDATNAQQPPGLGQYIPTADGNSRGMSHIAALLARSSDTADTGIDHGSKYAKSLGFDIEIEWPIDASEIAPKKKKKGKKKKKKGGSGKAKDEEEEDDDDDSSDDCRDSADLSGDVERDSSSDRESSGGSSDEGNLRSSEGNGSEGV